MKNKQSKKPNPRELDIIRQVQEQQRKKSEQASQAPQNLQPLTQEKELVEEKLAERPNIDNNNLSVQNEVKKHNPAPTDSTVSMLSQMQSSLSNNNNLLVPEVIFNEQKLEEKNSLRETLELEEDSEEEDLKEENDEINSSTHINHVMLESMLDTLSSRTEELKENEQDLFEKSRKIKEYAISNYHEAWERLKKAPLGYFDESTKNIILNIPTINNIEKCDDLGPVIKSLDNVNALIAQQIEKTPDSKIKQFFSHIISYLQKQIIIIQKTTELIPAWQHFEKNTVQLNNNNSNSDYEESLIQVENIQFYMNYLMIDRQLQITEADFFNTVFQWAHSWERPTQENTMISTLKMQLKDLRAYYRMYQLMRGYVIYGVAFSKIEVSLPHDAKKKIRLMSNILSCLELFNIYKNNQSVKKGQSNISEEQNNILSKISDILRKIQWPASQSDQTKSLLISFFKNLLNIALLQEAANKGIDYFNNDFNPKLPYIFDIQTLDENIKNLQNQDDNTNPDLLPSYQRQRFTFYAEDFFVNFFNGQIQKILEVASKEIESFNLKRICFINKLTSLILGETLYSQRINPKNFQYLNVGSLEKLSALFLKQTELFKEFSGKKTGDLKNLNNNLMEAYAEFQEEYKIILCQWFHYVIEQNRILPLLLHINFLGYELLIISTTTNEIPLEIIAVLPNMPILYKNTVNNKIFMRVFSEGIWKSSELNATASDEVIDFPKVGGLPLIKSLHFLPLNIRMEVKNAHVDDSHQKITTSILQNTQKVEKDLLIYGSKIREKFNNKKTMNAFDKINGFLNSSLDFSQKNCISDNILEPAIASLYSLTKHLKATKEGGLKNKEIAYYFICLVFLKSFQLFPNQSKSDVFLLQIKNFISLIYLKYQVISYFRE